MSTGSAVNDSQPTWACLDCVGSNGLKPVLQGRIAKWSAEKRPLEAKHLRVRKQLTYVDYLISAKASTCTRKSGPASCLTGIVELFGEGEPK